MAHQGEHTMSMGWGRFAAMIATSSAIMFVLTYQLVYRLEDATFSLNRLVASLAMGCVMTVVMLGFMWPMYRGRRTKVAVLVVASALAIVLLAANRQQVLVGDATFMRGMIPHHSVAINNARKARLGDPRVRRLADGIIASQVREIREMQLLLDDIGRHGERGGVALPARSAGLTPEMEAQARAAVR